MAVYCEGDSRMMEQLGEKQDFEAELTRQGFRHESFTLHVFRERAPLARVDWDPAYTVSVVNVDNEQCRNYRGGRRASWVSQFTRDLANGLFGAPPSRNEASGTSVAQRAR